jgi:hypothetical protein
MLIGGSRAKSFVQSFEFNSTNCDGANPEVGDPVSTVVASATRCNDGTGVTHGAESLEITSVDGVGIWDLHNYGSAVDFQDYAAQTVYVELDILPEGPGNHGNWTVFAITDGAAALRWPQVAYASQFKFLYIKCSAVDIDLYVYTIGTQYRIQMDITAQTNGATVDSRIYTVSTPSVLVATNDCTTNADNYIKGVKVGKIDDGANQPNHHMDHIQFNTNALDVD